MGFIGSSHATQTVLRVLEAGRKSGKVVILWGAPGIGKTALLRALADKHKLPLFVLIPSTMDPTDVAGLPALKQIENYDPVSGEKKTIMSTENTLPSWAEEAIRTGRAIIFFDEASTATPAVQASLLSVLQGRTIGNHVIPESVWMVAAANEATDAADGWDLAPPMANRFIHINYKPDDNDFLEGMACGWNNGELTQDDLDVRLKVVAFLRDHRSHINAMPSDAAAAGKAWGSYRSWDNMAEMLIALGPVDESDTVGMAARKDIIMGAVGENSYQAWLRWEVTLRLTPFDTILADPDASKKTWKGWKEMDPSSVYITLENAALALTKENASAVGDIFIAAYQHSSHQDIATAFASRLAHIFAPYDATVTLRVMRVYKDYILRVDNSGVRK